MTTSTTVPGDPGGIRSAASVLGETAEDAEVVVNRLQSLNECSGESMWRGPAADAFREKLGELPCKLVKLRDSYGLASEAMYRFANDVDQLQDEAGSAEQTERWAEDQVDFREREKQDAEICYPDADLSAYDQAIYLARQKLCAAKEEVGQVGESYRAAEDRCIASLNDASDAGIQNTFFGTVRECLAFIETVAQWVAFGLLVVAIGAILIGAGPGGWLAAAAIAGAIGGIATLGRWALGDEVGLTDLAFAVLAIVGVGYLAKAGFAAKLLGPLAPKAVSLADKASTATWLFKAAQRLQHVKGLPVWLRSGIDAYVKLYKTRPFFAQTLDASLEAFAQVTLPDGPMSSLPGILERIFRGPDGPIDCGWDRLPPADVPEEGESIPVPDPAETGPSETPPSPPRPSGPATGPIGESTAPGPTAPGAAESRGPSGPSGPGQAPSGPAPGPGGTDMSAPEPGHGGGPNGPEVPTGDTPNPGGAVGEPTSPPVGCDPAIDQPVPLPAPGQGPPPEPIVDAEPLPHCSDGSGAGGDEITITMPDGTVITIDPPDQLGDSMGRQAPDGFDGASSFDEPMEPMESMEPISSSRDLDELDDRFETSHDRGGPVAPDPSDHRPSVDEPYGDRRSLAEGAAPAPQLSSAPPPAPTATPPAAGPPPDGPAEPMTTAEVPAPATANLASAKPKLSLGSPLLIGGLAAGGLIGGGAAYVITDARHRLRKEEEEDSPLPPPVGLRF